MISEAVATLMAANGLTVIPNPVTLDEPPCTTGTQAMTRFPDTDSAVGTSDKLNDPSGGAYTSGAGTRGDKDGYVLFGHDITANNQQGSIVTYVPFVTSAWCYTVDPDGYVHQYDLAGAETPRPPRPTPTPTPTLTPDEAIDEALAALLATPEGELGVVSEAVAQLMLRNQLDSIPNPVGPALPCAVGTQDMTAFPDTISDATPTVDKVADPFGRLYTVDVDLLVGGLPGDKDGYLLKGHDIFADDDQINLQDYVPFSSSNWCYSVKKDGTVLQYEPGKLQVLDDMDELRSAFSEDDGSTRLVLLLTPEVARARAVWVQWQVLNRNPDIDLKVYVVWDSGSNLDPWTWPIIGLTPDDRVATYWDEERLAGPWFALNISSAARDTRPRFYDIYAYDVYYLFGPEARWGDEPPELLGLEFDVDLDSRLALRSALEELFPGLR